MTMGVGGELSSSGSGAACIGHPINAAWWLAQVMNRMKRPLKAGGIVLSGALGPMVAVIWGELLLARIEGVGTVHATFAKT